MREILDFLAELEQNNNKHWMDANRKRYETCRDKFKVLSQYFIDKISQFDPDIEGLELKHSMYRINRNNRFQKDLPPYKNYFATSISKGGKKSKYAEYYLHISPNGGSALGGGLWGPESADLAKIRQEIDYNPAPLLDFLKKRTIQKNFGGKLHNFGMLKRAPKGYPKDHPNVEILKHKHFSVFHRFTDEEVCAKDFKPKVLRLCKQLNPLITYLNEAVE